jgi:hypothetical protein
MAIYRLYRGVDSHDVAEAHELALLSAIKGFHIFNISAETPFQPEDTRELYSDARNVLLNYFPWARKEFAERDWPLPKSIDRVYVIDKALPRTSRNQKGEKKERKLLKKDRAKAPNVSNEDSQGLSQTRKRGRHCFHTGNFLFSI